MEKALADTHAIIWFVEGNSKLGTSARHKIQLAESSRAIIYISAISLIEMDYLAFKGRISAKIPQLIAKTITSSQRSTLQVIDVNFAVYNALKQVPANEVRDMPDRIIAATALAYKLPLITIDSQIKKWGKVRIIWS